MLFRGGIEALGVLGEERRIRQLGFELGQRRLDLFNLAGQGFQRVLVLEAELAGGFVLRLLALGFARGLLGLLGRLSGFHAFAALGDHIRIPARIDAPDPVLFPGDGGGGGAVDEIPVVAHQKRRAVIVRDQLFQEIQRFKIKIVGRLVEHQKVGRQS